LEYDSVKIVITDEVEEMISQNNFWTAITRTRNKLKIYWTPETENKTLSGLNHRKNKKSIT
jgi:ATP-dependent exoDNAse (exonuclease V) alpha subunit